MGTGLIVDGVSEYHALPLLVPRIKVPHQLVGIAKADLQPHAPAGQLAARVRKTVQDSLLRKGARHVIVLLDLDGRDCCCVAWAAELTARLEGLTFSLPCSVSAVIKVNQFENWLAADPEALQQVLGPLSKAAIRTLTGSADNADATRVLKAAASARNQNRQYDKVADAARLLKIADPLTMARNSRSFRRFLRLLDCPNYREQSRMPA